MKNILLFSLLLPFVLSAQKTKLENDTIYKDDVAYGILLKTGPALMPTYSIRTLTNTEIAVSKFDEATEKSDGTGGYYRFTFLGTGAFGHLYPGLNIGKGLAKVVVENDLIKDNAINPEGEKRFLALYPSQLTTQPTVVVNVNTNGPDYTTVERNRSMPVFESAGKLTQAGVNIGSCKTSTSYSGGKGIATITYYLPNGVECAQATCENIGAKTATVVTRKDNRSHAVTISNSAMKEKEIAEWLANNYYL